MALSEKKLREYLSYYGADIETWPEEARVSGYKARQNPFLAALFKDEEEFERFFLVLFFSDYQI